jgi:uncharacterized protein YjbJ (UPF0337 family)
LPWAGSRDKQITKGNKMNWDRVEGNWKQLKGKLKQQWGKLINDQFLAMEGKRDVLAGIVQESYGSFKDVAE